MSWYKNGSRVPTQYDNPVSLYSLLEPADLLFLRFKPLDVGDYYCNVTNQFGSAVSSTATLAISGKPLPASYYVAMHLIIMDILYWRFFLFNNV